MSHFLDKNARIAYLGATFIVLDPLGYPGIGRKAVEYFEKEITLRPHGFIICSDGMIGFPIPEDIEAKRTRIYFRLILGSQQARKSFNLFRRMMESDLSPEDARGFQIPVVYLDKQLGKLDPKDEFDTLIIHNNYLYLKKYLEAWEGMIQNLYPAYWQEKHKPKPKKEGE